MGDSRRNRPRVRRHRPRVLLQAGCRSFRSPKPRCLLFICLHECIPSACAQWVTVACFVCFFNSFVLFCCNICAQWVTVAEIDLECVVIDLVCYSKRVADLFDRPSQGVFCSFVFMSVSLVHVHSLNLFCVVFECCLSPRDRPLNVHNG